MHTENKLNTESVQHEYYSGGLGTSAMGVYFWVTKSTENLVWITSYNENSVG